MSCRTTPVNSAFTTYARLANGGVLSDVATLSTFHELRSSYSSRSEETRRVYSDEDYRALLGRQRERTVRNTTLSEARRQSILERLDAAIADTSTPDQATLYALHNLNPTVRNRGNAVASFQRRIANQLNLTQEQVQALWSEYENGVNRANRGQRPETYTEENIANVRDRLNMGTERGTVHAVVMLENRLRRHAADQALTQTPRIQRTPTSDPGSFNGFTVTEYGYDARNGRLEVIVQDENGERTNHAYRDVPAEIGNQFGVTYSGNSMSRTWFEQIRGASNYSYSDDIEAALASPAPRCAVCGQFANQLHDCPQIAEPRLLRAYNTRSRWSRQSATITGHNTAGEPAQIPIQVRLPAIREFREAFEAGPVSVEINEGASSWDAHGRYQWSSMTGRVTVYRDPEGALAFNTAQLRCSCPNYRTHQSCQHLEGATAAIRTRLFPPARRPNRRMTPEERAQVVAEQAQRAAEAAVFDWTRNEETLAEARRTWLTDSEILYSENFNDFEQVYNNAISTRPEGSSGVPYFTENVLNGMATRGSGQAFGMEIEYEFPPGTNISEAQRRIGQELFEAGLAGSPQQAGYGASKQRGFRDTHLNADGSSNWSWERDGSVNGGELVTPAMYDEPETWERLKLAAEILRRNGAVSTKRAGAHVHVGTSMYGGDARKYAELARLMTQHEDVVYRIASDPARGTHRNSGYAAPLNQVPATGFEDVGQARSWQGGRGRALNFGGVNSNDPNTDHPEFRIYDSTLDPGAMQAQIKLSVAMTHAAARIAEQGPTARTKEPLGSHAKRGAIRGRRALTSEQMAEDTATFRSLLDTLFQRKSDKDQLTHLFAINKWTKRS